MQSLDNLEGRLIHFLQKQQYLALFQALIVTKNLSSGTLTELGGKADTIFKGIVALINGGLLTAPLQNSLLQGLNAANALTSIFNYYKDQTSDKIDYRSQLVALLQQEDKKQGHVEKVVAAIQRKIACEDDEVKRRMDEVITAVIQGDITAIRYFAANGKINYFRLYSPSASPFLIAAFTGSQEFCNQLFEILHKYFIANVRDIAANRLEKNCLFMWAAYLRQEEYLMPHLNLPIDKKYYYSCLNVTKDSNWPLFIMLAEADKYCTEQEHKALYNSVFLQSLYREVSKAKVIEILGRVFAKYPKLFDYNIDFFGVYTNHISLLLETNLAEKLSLEDIDTLLLSLLEAGAPCTEVPLLSPPYCVPPRFSKLIMPLVDAHKYIVSLRNYLVELKTEEFKAQFSALVRVFDEYISTTLPIKYYQRAEKLYQIAALLPRYLQEFIERRSEMYQQLNSHKQFQSQACLTA